MGKRYFKDKLLNPDMNVDVLNKSYVMIEYWIKKEVREINH